MLFCKQKPLVEQRLILRTGPTPMKTGKVAKFLNEIGETTQNRIWHQSFIVSKTFHFTALIPHTKMYTYFLHNLKTKSLAAVSLR